MPCHSIQKEEELWHLALSKHEYGNYLRRSEEMGHTTLFGRRFQVSALPTGVWTVANLDGGLFIIYLGLCHSSEPGTAIIARVSWRLFSICTHFHSKSATYLSPRGQ